MNEAILDVGQQISALPLTHGAFQSWRKDEFVPHMQMEEKNEQRIIAVESTLGNWIKALTVAGGVVFILGGYIWYETKDEIKQLQMVAIANQKAIERIGARQEGVLEALKDQREVDRNQMTLLMKIVDKHTK